ncbi:M24 family metallopeptidase [Mesorhizobium sophorae]|uniref:M24 family metallopeptidase n=1 Tax=Mesorhizobium sophorae TaxID=1300294 RepID=UPI00142DD1DF|nr:Xaa-Pro peptidase family protein [Mesorhizobium sophorae]
MNDRSFVRAFETSEYCARLDKVRALMSEAGMDALVIFSKADQYYLLGYDARDASDHAVLVTLDDDPYFILRKMDADATREAGCWLSNDRVIAYAESYVGGTGEESVWEFIGQFVKSKVKASARIGVEVSGLGVFSYPKFVAALGGQEPLDGSDLVRSCRAIKSERELSYMREAAAIGDRAILAGLGKIAVGVRHCDAAAAIMSALCAGTESIHGGPPFAPYIRGGEVAKAPHQAWMDDVFAAGQQYYMICCANRLQYPAPLARIAHVGPVTTDRKRRHEGAMAGFHAAVDAMRPGATCADVARAYQAAIRPYGFIKDEGRFGYSVGLGFIDGPSLALNNDTEILANMTFHFESTFIDHGETYLLSDTVRVTDLGGELLSTVPRDLFERPV